MDKTRWTGEPEEDAGRQVKELGRANEGARWPGRQGRFGAGVEVSRRDELGVGTGG